MHYAILTLFTKQETRLLIFLTNILQWYPKQKVKQKQEGNWLKLPIAAAQVKAGNNSKKLLNQIRQIV